MFLEYFYYKNFLTKNNIFSFLALFFNFSGSINKKKNKIYLTFSVNKKLLPLFFYLVHFYNFGKLYKKNDTILFQNFSNKDFKFFNSYIIPHIINKKFYTKVLKKKKICQSQFIFEKFILFYLLNNININIIKNFSSLDFYITLQYNTKNKIALIYLHSFLKEQFLIFCTLQHSLKFLYLKKQSVIYYFLLLNYNFFQSFFVFKNFLLQNLLYIFIIKKYNLHLNTTYNHFFLKLKWYFLFDFKNEI